MKKHLPTILSVLIFTAIATLYCLVSKPVFLVSSSAIILRDRIENPDFINPDIRNRWVWIKDGLSLKSQLVTDQLLKNFLDNQNPQKGRVTEQMTEQLRKSIKINYTGADENRFLIEIKSHDPAFAYNLNKLLLEKLKQLSTQEPVLIYQQVIEDLQNRYKELQKFRKTRPEAAYYQQIINKLDISKNIYQSQGQNKFIIIKNPNKHANLIWPKVNRIIPIFIFLGIVFGLFLEYLIYLKTNSYYD